MRGAPCKKLRQYEYVRPFSEITGEANERYLAGSGKGSKHHWQQRDLSDTATCCWTGSSTEWT